MQITAIANLVSLNLIPPEFLSGFGPLKKRAVMVMPETAVDLYYGLKFWKYQVGLSRKIAAVRVELVTSRSEFPLQYRLGPGIFVPNSRHHSGARLRVDYICHIREKMYLVFLPALLVFWHISPTG